MNKFFRQLPRRPNRCMLFGGFKPWRSSSYALIRAILECSSELCNYAIPQYLSDELEKVQKPKACYAHYIPWSLVELWK